uniref:Uncharacterized protein n=1 Tax=Panagrolaimus sp. PS1159 TaxID=55785 RepID=A0AC35G1G6_9BILA
MLDKDPEETMTATFNRFFICKNNFLCCMNQNFKNALMLVFSTKEKCELIFNAILKSKVRNPVVNENELFKNNFYLPLIKAIKNGANGFLKTIVLDFVNSFENNERIYYFDTFAELSLSTELKENIEDEKHAENSIHFSSASETVSSIPLKCDRPKRSLNKNISYQECDENDECQRKMKKIAVSIKPSHKKSTNSHFDEPTPKNSPKNVDFDIVEYLHDEKFDKKLLVFSSNERKQCYEYVFVKTTINYYRCIKCFEQKKVIKIKTETHNDGSRTFDFNTEKHICEPIEYLPGNYQSLIIKSSNFKFVKHEFCGKTFPLLIIFDINDKNMCYRFGFDSYGKFYVCNGCTNRGLKFFARFIQHEEQTAVELCRFRHICKPRKYIP